MESGLREKFAGTYRCRSYLILSDWDRRPEIGAPIDAAGCDRPPGEAGSAAGRRGTLPAGSAAGRCGETGAVGGRRRYGCRAYAFNEVDGVDGVLLDGEKLRVGERLVEVIHAPIPADDAVCFFCAEEGVLFSGAPPPGIMQTGGSYARAYRQLLVRYSRLSITAFYAAHDAALACDVSEIVRQSLAKSEAGPGTSGQPPSRLQPIIAIGTGGTLSMYGKRIAREEIIYV